jgi:MFS family permease
MTVEHQLDMAQSGRKVGVWTIAALFAGESMLRALNVSVISIQAYDLLGSSQRVSIVSTIVSCMVLFSTLSLPFVFRGLRRRWVYSIGITLMIFAALIFSANFVVGQVLATYLRNVGASILGVTLSLYIMDNISKAQLTTSEPVRMTLATVSWVTGPAIGTWLYAHYGPVAPQLAVISAGIVLMTGFWIARVRDPVTLASGTLENFNPLSNALAFFKQPRLRLAWAIVLGRSCFWSALFIYGPLVMIEGGLSKANAGFIVAASQFTLPCSIIFGVLAKRHGVRPIICLCFAAIAILCLFAGSLGHSHLWIAVACLMFAGVFASGLDGVGGIPFYRSVRPLQRQRMSSVYRTFIECAELFPAAIFMVLLLYFPTPIVFIVIAAFSVFLAALSWKYLPKSM